MRLATIIAGYADGTETGMTGPGNRYHSITCTDPCPGWGCDCWCHDCKEAN